MIVYVKSQATVQITIMGQTKYHIIYLCFIKSVKSQSRWTFHDSFMNGTRIN
jgi:hypothetical protein